MKLHPMHHIFALALVSLVFFCSPSQGFSTSSGVPLRSLNLDQTVRRDSPSQFTKSHPRLSEPRLLRTILTTSVVAGDSSAAVVKSPFITSAYERTLQRLSKAWKNLRYNPVWQWRLVFGSFFGSLFLFRPYLDSHLLVNCWNYLLHSQALPARVFRADSWEWMWAISCFGVYIHAFGWADRLVRQADESGQVHPWKKYRLQDRYQADIQRRRQMEAERLNMPDDHSITLSENLPTTTAEDNDVLVKPRHSAWNWEAWGLLGEVWVYAVPLLIWDILAPRRHRKLLAFGPPTTLGVLGGIVGSLLMYDFLFFCGHWMMHKIPWLYRTVHAKHHVTKEVRACEIVRLSIPEEVLEVGFSIIALNVLKVHPVARSIYNMIITFLLTELHCGFDFPWTPQNVIPFGFATGSRRHHYHHRIGKHYYQKFFHHVDRWFGFFPVDDGSLDGDSVKANAYVPPSWQNQHIRHN